MLPRCSITDSQLICFASLPIHFWFHSSNLKPIFSRLSRWPFCASSFDSDFFSFACAARLASASSLNRLFSSSSPKALSILPLKARQTLQIYYLVNTPERSTITLVLHCVAFLFILYEIFFHFHFVFNSHREETRVLSYSYVAGGRVKTLFSRVVHNC